MTPFDPDAYGPAVAVLLRPERTPDLGPCTPNEAARASLGALDLGPAADGPMASACRSGLWLLHDFLDESHRVSQGLPDGAGAFWHGIMHRREGDFGNAKYWFGRVGAHPVFAALARDAAELAAAAPGAPPSLTRSTRWDPDAFVDLVEACVRGRSPHADLARRVQRREWELLFDWCWRKAVGG
jgi:hypothetical protein